MFPEGYFYILSRKHGFALDVYDGQTKSDANIIVWPQKFQDSDNQLWSFEQGRLINKKSGHALDVSSSAFKKDKTIVQKKRNSTKQSQEWIFDNGWICSKEYPSLVLDIKGDNTKGGASVILYKRKDTDNLNQLWQIESFQQFEGALNMATTSVPLHKKEGFGQPRPGYAAEPGVPPELTKVPENNKIAGVGNNVSPTATTNTNVGNSRVDPILAQYGSFYGGSTTSPPPPQQGPVPSNNNYQAPPLPPKNANTLPPPAQPLQVATPSNFPAPIPPSNTSSTYPPPPSSSYPQQQQQQQPSYQSNYSTSPPSHSPYFPSPTTSSGYPPSSPSNYNSGNNQNYPPYPPSNGGMPMPTGYNQPPTGYNQPPSGYNQAPTMPSADHYNRQDNMGYPAPPPLPAKRPEQQTDQYGYPSYPQ